MEDFSGMLEWKIFDTSHFRQKDNQHFSHVKLSETWLTSRTVHLYFSAPTGKWLAYFSLGK